MLPQIKSSAFFGAMPPSARLERMIRLVVPVTQDGNLVHQQAQACRSAKRADKDRESKQENCGCAANQQ
jgi:hypothetical protein